jgi:hypothetical protein
MTVIVRVAGWLVGWLLFGFHVHETQQFVNSVHEKAKIFTTLLLLPPPTPPTPQLSPPTIWFLPFNIPIRIQQREGCVCQMRNYMQRGGGSSVVGERGGRLRKGGFPSVVRTPSVPHFQLPIFYLPEISVFSSFSFAFCVRKGT